MSSRVEEVADAAGGGVWIEEDMVLALLREREMKNKWEWDVG